LFGGGVKQEVFSSMAFFEAFISKSYVFLLT
jgi:hypothetical protein